MRKAITVRQYMRRQRIKRFLASLDFADYFAIAVFVYGAFVAISISL